MQNGIAAITRYGGATVGMRTMLDALVPAVDAMSGGGGGADQSAAVTAAYDGMVLSAGLEGCAGRSNYVASEHMKGIPDPGAVAVFLAFQAAAIKASVLPPDSHILSAPFLATFANK